MADRFLVHPFRLRAQGGVAVTDDPDRHLRDKVEAVLFTSPGERVNAPTFGAGIARAVFEPLSELSLAALEFRVSQALQNDLGDEIIVDGVDLVAEDDGTLRLDLAFRRRTDREPRNLEVRL
jgi:phage baseplate assembly protein W